jgi:uncharacterized protein (TIGR02594 family)
MLILRKGSRGPDVERLQRLLNSELTPSPNLRVDGVFGANTNDTVMRFQMTRSLEVDGIVGPQTWTALGQQFAVRPGPPSQYNPDSTPRPPVNVQASDPPWMATVMAEYERGVKGIPGSSHNQRIIEYHSTTSLRATTDETAWCSSFANWVMKNSGYRGTNSAAAISWLDWGVELKTPRYGAITVVYDTNHPPTRSGNHVSFWTSQDSARITLLGGNQGNAVQPRSYPLRTWEIKGYRWPA